MRAAIESSALGATTALVCKSLLGKAHTVMAEGGIAAALGNVDAADEWTTPLPGHALGRQVPQQLAHGRAAREGGARPRARARAAGAASSTARPPGHMSQRAFGGHTHRRLVHIGDRTGLELIRTLQDSCVHQDVDVFMECTVTHLLKDGDRVCGAFGYWRATGELVLFRARSFVLATGGTGRCYEITSNSWECTGDGQALAYAAGAELVDMEFVQFHPTGMVWPPGVQGPARHRGGARRGRHPHATRTASASWSATTRSGWSSRRATSSRGRSTPRSREGRGSPRGGVFLDVSHLPAETVRKKLPSMYDAVPGAGRASTSRRAPMEVGPDLPLHHGRDPGRRRDGRRAASSGLFAAGECAGGLSGATRLGGNSLSDLLVFGRRAGAAAAEYAAEGGRRRDRRRRPRRRVRRARRASSPTTATRTRTPSTPSCSRRCSATSASTATRRD